MSKYRHRIGALFIVAVCFPHATLSQTDRLPPHPIVAYHDSWNELPAATATTTSLATLPGYISVVVLAFARPDLTYRGDLDIGGTGLEYRFNGRVLRDAIASLKAEHPATQVLLSVGGAAYKGWSALDETAILHLVRDLGADGVDIDFEPARPDCIAGIDGRIRCRTDAVWSQLVARFRAVLPRPAVLTMSVWSVGAFGEGAFRFATPSSRYTGLMLNFLHAPLAQQVDMLSINGYDAGPQFDPMMAFRAYREIWPGRLALGVAVARSGGSGPFYQSDEAEALARKVAQDPGGGMMVYPLLALPEGALNANPPDGRTLVTAMCRGMSVTGCDEPVR